MKKIRLNSNYIPLCITTALFFVLFAIGSISFRGFFSMQVLLNLFIDNAHLIITALGCTMVIISGGIDLSVGSVIALVAMTTAYLVTVAHMPLVPVLIIDILIGVTIGLINGVLITYFNFQPFIATLTTQFLGRGLVYLISTDTINIVDPTFVAMSEYRIPMPGNSFISLGVVIALVVLAIFIYIAHYTKFGRTIYAMGGNEQSARLMGLPVDKAKVGVYLLSGTASSIAGIVFSLYMLSGYGAHANGIQMDAAAAAVIGGTIMSGGVGYVVGTVIGVLIEGIIQTLIMFNGSLNAWWTSIAIAFLLLVFIVIQRIITIRRETKKITRKVQTIKNTL